MSIFKDHVVMQISLRMLANASKTEKTIPQCCSKSLAWTRCKKDIGVHRTHWCLYTSINPTVPICYSKPQCHYSNLWYINIYKLLSKLLFIHICLYNSIGNQMIYQWWISPNFPTYNFCWLASNQAVFHSQESDHWCITTVFPSDIIWLNDSLVSRYILSRSDISKYIRLYIHLCSRLYQA